VSQNALLRCAGVQRFADAYLDGEFGEADRAELEAHLAVCEACRQRIKLQSDWKQTIKAAGPREKAPAALRNRVMRSIGKEQRSRRPAAVRRFATRVLPVAAVGGLLATFMITRGNFAPVAADVVAKHQRNLPLEFSGGGDQLKRWYSDKVDFPVRPLSLPRASLRGGRLANIRDHQAAYLLYELNGNKVSVFVFDPSNMNFEARRKAMVGGKEVFLDEERGYNVAVFRDRGVGYAIASDLGENEVLNLVSHATVDASH
jgi:mycothiol system anti-sigma-R factor